MQAPPTARDILVLAQIVDLVRGTESATRSFIEAETGLGRAVVNDRLAEGIELGVLEELEPVHEPGRRGRPSRSLRFRADGGVVLSASLGAKSMYASVSDLEGNALASTDRAIDVADGPEATLRVVHRTFQRLLARAGDGAEDRVWGLAIGVPGPVEFRTGRVIAPPIMPGWDGFDVRGWFLEKYGAPVWVDNEVNLMAYGEWARGVPQERRDLLFVKVATGIGAGLVTNGHLHRGDNGAAGDIGHVHVTDDKKAICRCGRTGCLEAVAGGWALLNRLEDAARAGKAPWAAQRLAEKGELTLGDLGTAEAHGDKIVATMSSRNARVAGQAIAGVVNFANPGTLVLGGGAIRGSSLFFDTFRETVLENTIALATRNLTIRTASLDFYEGAIGGALLAIDHLFRPSALRLWLADADPRVRADEIHAVG
ncbi:MAG: ROK family protein [Actinobacteria bacterium]|nr:ROK family protein [Actinomycetota bacterium]